MKKRYLLNILALSIFGLIQASDTASECSLSTLTLTDNSYGRNRSKNIANLLRNRARGTVKPRAFEQKARLNRFGFSEVSDDNILKLQRRINDELQAESLFDASEALKMLNYLEDESSDEKRPKSMAEYDAAQKAFVAIFSGKPSASGEKPMIPSKEELDRSRRTFLLQAYLVYVPQKDSLPKKITRAAEEIIDTFNTFRIASLPQRKNTQE